MRHRGGRRGGWTETRSGRASKEAACYGDPRLQVRLALRIDTSSEPISPRLPPENLSEQHRLCPASGLRCNFIFYNQGRSTEPQWTEEETGQLPSKRWLLCAFTLCSGHLAQAVLGNKMRGEGSSLIPANLSAPPFATGCLSVCSKPASLPGSAASEHVQKAR